MKMPDSRYTVTLDPDNAPNSRYVAKFCGRTISEHGSELEAATALWDYHVDRMHDRRTACPLPLGMGA